MVLIFPLATPAQSWTFNHFAGAFSPGYSDGNGSAARFNYPFGVAVDAAGTLYAADSNNHIIRKITPTGMVTTLAGFAGAPGSADGTGSAARFRAPQSVAVDAAGNVYVADTSNHSIRKITPAGMVTTLAGLALTPGNMDGTGSVARFTYPYGVAVDTTGMVYVADTNNHTIRKITPAGAVTTLAGLAGSSGSANGTGSVARFNTPRGIAVDAAGTLAVADTNNHTIRKITPAGAVTTLAGSALSPGSADGTGSAARFNTPRGVAVDSAGTVYVADASNHTIRAITPAGGVTTAEGLAGSSGSADGTGSAARFYIPQGIAVDSAGSVYVADTYNHTIRKISPAGGVTTMAGLAGSPGSADGSGSAARFYFPSGVVMDSAGNVYLADNDNHTIRKATPAGDVTTLAGLAGSLGNADGTGSIARFNYPLGVAVDSAGIVYVADSFNHTIRKITPAGAVTTLAGLAGWWGSVDGTGSTARFQNPSGVAVDSAGIVYVADNYNHTIRKITPSGTVTTLAGLAGVSGSANGTGSVARFYNPARVAVDSAGYVYVADTYNYTIRKITPAGAVTTLAGLAGFIGSANGTGSAARFYNPSGVAVDSAGIVYVADYYNHTIRKITAAGGVTTLAGLAGTPGTTDGNGGIARFNNPSDVAINPAGNLLFVVDSSNHAIRSGAPAIADIAVVDAATGCTGTGRQLDTAPQTATSWLWQMTRQPANSTAAISSATLRNPTFTPDVADRYEFLLTATSGAGSSVSAVVLNASAAPVIGTQPAPQSACVGGRALFSFAVSGATGFQWYNSGNPISGATASDYTINPVGSGDAGTYYASATVACGTIFSGNAALSVQSSPLFSGNSLLGGKDNGQITLNWGAASNATAYDVKRCDGICMPITPIASPIVTSYSEADDASSYFYAVEARNACGSTP